MKSAIVLILLFFSSTWAKNSTDLIVYSFDRPLQLHAFLESCTKLIDGIDQYHVVCRASDGNYLKGYQQLSKYFPYVLFHFQSSAPKRDFKQLTLQCFNSGKSSYILFAVDDIIVKDAVILSDCISAMEQSQAYAFFLRLGKNITRSYRNENSAPKLSELSNNIYSWIIKTGTGNWGYPNNLDMTLYRKKDISHCLQTMNYDTPNTFESTWSGRHAEVDSKLGLCFSSSKIINIPLNMVQSDYPNQSMNFKTAQELLSIYFEGKIIDISQFYKINNNSPHMDYEPTFINING